MAINKAKTSGWMKAFIIVLIVAFISSFLYAGIAGLFDMFKSTPATTPVAATGDLITTTNAQFKPGIDSLTAMVASEPTSYTALVGLANAYFDWAQTLSTPAAGTSQPTTAAIEAAGPLWLSAKDAYARAVKVKQGDAGVETDYAIVTYYSGETSSAIAIAESVSIKQPDFAQVWLNLGVFYTSSGQSAKAITAFERYLKLDPKGQNVTFANEQLKALKSGTATP